jgi:RNA polymerase sigma factor FliA
MYAELKLPSADALIERHIDLVRRIAYHLIGRLPDTVQAEDLIQAGVVGLLEAARNFDGGQGASFETFAGIRIRGAMLDEVRRLDWAPRSTHRVGREISEAINTVEARTGAQAQPQQIARELDVDLDTYHRMLQKVTETRIFSLEALFGNDGDQADNMQSPGIDPSSSHLREAFVEAAQEAISELPEREQLVLSLYYTEELNLKEVGEVLGVSESRVCQIHGQALARLKARLSDWQGE